MKKWFKKLFVTGALCLSIFASEGYGDGYDLSKITKYGGITSLITMKTGRIFSGNMYVVDSGHARANDNTSAGNFDIPFATIDYAVGRCTANNNDLILVMPGHAETVSAASGLDLDVAGITIAGLGTGSDRPTITVGTAATADIDVDAVNITLYNIIINSNVDSIVAPLDVNANYFSLIDCETSDRDGIGEAITFIDWDGDFGFVDGWKHVGSSTAGAAIGLDFAAADDFELKNANVYGNFSVGALVATSTAALRFWIHDSYIWTENAVDICGTSSLTSTGAWGPNILCRLQDNAANITEAVQGQGAHFFGPIEIVNANNEQSMETNITASTD